MPEFSITTDLVQSGSDVTSEFAAFSAAGFSATHWCQNWIGNPLFYTADYIAQVAELAGRAGLRVADVHGYSGTGSCGVRYTEELFLAVNVNRLEFAAALGATTLVLHLPALPEHGAEASAALLERLRPVADREGVRLAAENLVSQSPDFLDDVFARCPWAGFCFDSGHANLQGRPELVERYADRLCVTHLHDNDGTGDQHRLPGEGGVDWSRIAGDLRRSEYGGTVNLEVGKPDDEDLTAFCRRARQTVEALFG